MTAVPAQPPAHVNFPASTAEVQREWGRGNPAGVDNVYYAGELRGVALEMLSTLKIRLRFVGTLVTQSHHVDKPR